MKYELDERERRYEMDRENDIYEMPALDYT